MKNNTKFELQKFFTNHPEYLFATLDEIQERMFALRYSRVEQEDIEEFIVLINSEKFTETLDLR